MTDGTNIVALAQKQAEKKQRPQPAPTAPGPGKTRVYLQPGELHTVLGDAEDALVAADLGIYAHGGRLVRIGWKTVKTAGGGEIRALRLFQVTPPHLIDCMSRVITFYKYNLDGGEVNMDCPKVVAEAYLARPKWKHPEIMGVITSPTFRPDGTLITTPGYDAETGLFFEPLGIAFPPIPDEPTRDDATRALALLSELIEETPFVAGCDRAVALSGFMTTVVRRSIPAAPGHFTTAPEIGSGKSFIIRIAAVIATGDEPIVSSQGDSDEELEKRLSTSVMDGDDIISIDNCERPLRGAFLAQMLSEPAVKPRILGKSKNVPSPNTAMIFGTGINLVIADDLTRRCLLARLDAECEQPYKRKYKKNPIAMVKADRGKYVAAVLTIIRAYGVAGRPAQQVSIDEPIDGYDVWSRWVRDALLWLGVDDPCRTIEEIRYKDPGRSSREAVITQWAAVIKHDKRLRVSEVIEMAEERANDVHANSSLVHRDFHNALADPEVAGDNRGQISRERLGKWLAKNEKRVIKGYRFVRHTGQGGATLWYLAKVEDQGALPLGQK